MAWVQGELERTFTVAAPADEVRDYFRDPAKFKRAFGQMEDSSQIDDQTWAWTLQEKSEKGIKFQGKYSVRYEDTEDGVRWSSLDGGNMRSEGSARVESIDDQSARVIYAERLATDLPIPKLAAKVFGPIVGREVSRGIGDFLDRSKEILEGGE